MQNLANAIFQKIPEIFGLCKLFANFFTTVIFALIFNQKNIVHIERIRQKIILSKGLPIQGSPYLS